MMVAIVTATNGVVTLMVKGLSGIMLLNGVVCRLGTVGSQDDGDVLVPDFLSSSHSVIRLEGP